MSLYSDLKESGAELDSHYSDLYVKSDPSAVAILREHGAHWSAFVSQIDGAVWLDVPFAYEPFWLARQGKEQR